MRENPVHLTPYVIFHGADQFEMSRKKRLSVGEGIVMLLLLPSSLMGDGKVCQPVALLRSPFVCRTKPVDGEGQETITSRPDSVQVKVGKGVPLLMQLLPVSAT